MYIYIAHCMRKREKHKHSVHTWTNGLQRDANVLLQTNSFPFVRVSCLQISMQGHPCLISADQHCEVIFIDVIVPLIDAISLIAQTSIKAIKALITVCTTKTHLP